ncbi:putative lipoprotein [Cupriavidus basilensis]|uniref:Putative lipoprotein n=2 Tax=Cupriavidus basilensis TaxID=68895 RepID=A0A0C4YU27_9BURK|nr:putative lipoprotein [Cupriavidus basilensis]
MTDAPACGYDHVFVTVDKVRVHSDPNANANGTGWVDVTVSPARRIDPLSTFFNRCTRGRDHQLNGRLVYST